MEELLASVGIENNYSCMYEYESIQLDWWHTEHKTHIGIGIREADEGWTEITVVFFPDVDSMFNRMNDDEIIFNTYYKDDKLRHRSIVEKKTYEFLVKEHLFQYSKDLEAYESDSYESTQHVLRQILDLIVTKKPAQVFEENWDAMDDDDIPLEIGDTLDHFIAMMYANDTPYIAKEMINGLELAFELEGIEYIEQLKKDIEAPSKYNFQKEYEVNEAALKIIQETIRNYKPKVK